jgi:AcrR family transcriptional regulator
MTEALEVWTRPDRGRRQPRHSREEIAAAAIRIADTEGFDELSMRRLASELGAGTMTLYHYVRTKDELLALVHDAIMGELLVPGDLPDEWRAALTLIARRARDAIRRHPWILEVHDDPAPGPNGVRHWDQSMQAVSSLGLSVGERFELVMAVDEYVFGFCLMERANASAADAGPPGPELDGMREYVDGLIASGDYPTLAAIWDDPGLEETWTQMQRQVSDPDRFDRNLQRLLDGFEAELGRRRSRRKR